MPQLKIQNLTKRFPGVVALNQIDFELEAGEIHAICGENGAGKSTLIKILSGIYPVGSYEGDIFLDGQPATFLSPTDAGAAGISVIYQELALVGEMTVAENIFLGREPTRLGRIDWNAVYARTRELLDRYQLPLDPGARVGELGVGEQQLVEIVKALSQQTRILLLDEPTAALTETEVGILLNIVRELKSRGITCVYISHKLDEVFAIADRITVIRDGRSIATHQTAQTRPNQVIREMVGREITELFPRRPGNPGEVRLAVKNLTVAGTHRHRPILEDISFELHAGEVLGLGGLMGAGRTELLMFLFGVTGRRVQGEVWLNGKPYRGTSPRDAIRGGMVMISEDRKRFGLNLAQSIGFNLSLASLARFTPAFLINASLENRSNQALFEALGIKAPGLETAVETLSGGNQQKVVLGKGIMTEPAVIFLDEPTRGIDVGSKQEVYELINRLTDQGKAVLLVSSEMPELLGMSDRIIILSEGKIGGVFTREEADQEILLAAAMRHHHQKN
ncbi:MAG: ATP-binding cassette domain-containing protein [Calditrichaeota bacterium]|nr:ATP-binding cassette domain-containing protein [Calditrichota bacterium]HQU71952.1 sugar ABC transporter ATP-binding protein [Calditrichia bacterium]